MACLFAVLLSQLENWCLVQRCRHATLSMTFATEVWIWRWSTLITDGKFGLSMLVPESHTHKSFLVISGVPFPTRTIKCHGGHGPAYTATSPGEVWTHKVIHYTMTYPLQHSDLFCESQRQPSQLLQHQTLFVDMIRLYLRQISRENIKVNNRLQSSLLRM